MMELNLKQCFAPPFVGQVIPKVDLQALVVVESVLVELLTSITDITASARSFDASPDVYEGRPIARYFQGAKVYST